MTISETNHDTQAQRMGSGGLTEDIRGVMADIERRLDRLKIAHADREREREELEQRSADVESRAESLAEQAQALEQQQRAHAEAVAAAEARFEELDRREATARQAFERAKAEHDETREELKFARESLEHDRESLDADRLAFEAERERTREVAEEAAQQLKDLEEDREALAQTAVELDERQKDLDDQASTLAERFKELEQQRAAMDERAAKLEAQDRKLADLSRQTAEQRERLSGDSSDLEQQKRWLAEQTKQADLLRARVSQLESELAEARQAVEASTISVDPQAADEANEALAHELDVTKAKLRDAATIIGELREQLDQARSAGSGEGETPTIGDEHLLRRKRRLEFVRRALRDEQAKVAKASAIIRERSEAMTAQTGAPQRSSKASTPVKSGPLAGLARLGVGMAGVSVAMVLLAAVSWLAAGEISTPTYAASVSVAHDARGRDVLAEDLAGWQRFHEELMTDPRFYEFAAERMRQRGLLGLSDAVTVKAFVEESVSWSSGRDGELKLEVRQPGADRAERVAETLAIALVGQANAARERRPDGLPSVVAEDARASDRALTSEQPIYAGGIFAGLTLCSLALGGLVSRRIGRLREQVAAEGATAMDDMGEQTESRFSIN